MEKRKTIKPHAPLLISIGEQVQSLNDSATGIYNYKLVKLCLQQLLYLKDVENVQFIGQEAQRLLDELSNRKDSETVDYPDRGRVRDSINNWKGRLQEISKNWILSYPETDIDADKLLKGPAAFLEEQEFNMLEPLEKQSLSEATSSLLFNNFTSAEFMALRTAESLLKKWYEKRIGKKLGRTTWGEVLEKLSQEFPKKEERPKELLLLDYLRERRNEIAHPEAVSDSIQASTTFLNVISLCKSLHPYIHPTWVRKRD